MNLKDKNWDEFTKRSKAVDYVREYVKKKYGDTTKIEISEDLIGEVINNGYTIEIIDVMGKYKSYTRENKLNDILV